MKESFKRVFNSGWTNLKRNSYSSVGTAGVMGLVLLIFSALMLLNFVSQSVISSLRDKIDVSVYLETSAPEDQILKIKSDIEKLSDVKSVTYISRDQALADFKARHAGDPLIQESLAELNENPLPAALNIKAVSSEDYPTIAASLEANRFRGIINKIDYYENEAVIKKVEGIAGAAKTWGLVAIFFLVGIAVLVTFNTIRLTIYNQKQEIEVMRLVGGSNWFIRAPYLIEGGLYGAFAAIVTTAIFYPTLYLISPRISALIPNLNAFGYFAANAVQYVVVIAAIGIFLGVVSSSVAIRRFLKV